MTSFISRLLAFIGGKSSSGPVAPAETREEYQEYNLVAHPLREGNQFRISGAIEKKQGDTILKRHFIRADVFSSEKEASEFTLRKARQIVDQQGGILFADGAQDGRV